jgi:spermidine/putrescine transport system substrate-binding protein
MEAPFLAEYKNAFGETPQVAIFADDKPSQNARRLCARRDGPLLLRISALAGAGTFSRSTRQSSRTGTRLPGVASCGISVDPARSGSFPMWATRRSRFVPISRPNMWARPWDILFDPKYKGRIAVLEGVDDTVPFIARTIGIDAYTMSDADWQKGPAKLKDLTKQLRFVSADETSLHKGLASGELVVARAGASSTRR